MFATLALLLVAQGGEAELRARVAAQPEAVQRYVARRAMCNHWLGEPPYDAGRRRDIERAVRQLGCENIGGEKAFLRRHFAGRAEILALLDEADDISGW
jgi:hypothetical protein